MIFIHQNMQKYSFTFLKDTHKIKLKKNINLLKCISD